MPAKFRCRSCLKTVVIDDQQSRAANTVDCGFCRARLVIPVRREVASDAELTEYRRLTLRTESGVSGADSVQLGSGGGPRRETGEGVIGALGALAWVTLVAHAVAALLVWIKFGRVDVGHGTEVNPIGAWLGAGLVIQGVFLCVLYRAIFWIGKNVTRLARSEQKSARSN